MKIYAITIIMLCAAGSIFAQEKTKQNSNKKDEAMIRQGQTIQFDPAKAPGVVQVPVRRARQFIGPVPLGRLEVVGPEKHPLVPVNRTRHAIDSLD